MIQKWRIRKAIVHQINNLRLIANGSPVNYPSLGAATLGKDDVRLARRLLSARGDWEDTAPVDEFQKEFAKWNGSRYAFAFMAGRVALSACIYALDLKPGDEVIVPGYTCIVVPNAFHYAGINVVYSDIELETYGLDALKATNSITKRTRAILIHHLYGLVCRDYEQLLKLADDHGLHIIEDCAHATGAEYRGVKVGNRGALAFYSSERSKLFNTIQGGVAITNNVRFASRLKRYWQHAPTLDTEHIDHLLHSLILAFFGQRAKSRWLLGDIYDILYGEKEVISTAIEEFHGVKPSDYGAKMAAPVATLALNQLRKLEYYNIERRKTALYWTEWCQSKGYLPPVVIPESLPVFLRYPVMVEPHLKADPSWSHKELGVELGRWFVSHTHPAPSYVDNCPKADEAVARCVNFPGIISC